MMRRAASHLPFLLVSLANKCDLFRSWSWFTIVANPYANLHFLPRHDCRVDEELSVLQTHWRCFSCLLVLPRLSVTWGWGRGGWWWKAIVDRVSCLANSPWDRSASRAIIAGPSCLRDVINCSRHLLLSSNFITLISEMDANSQVLITQAHGDDKVRD